MPLIGLRLFAIGVVDSIIFHINTVLGVNGCLSFSIKYSSSIPRLLSLFLICISKRVTLLYVSSDKSLLSGVVLLDGISVVRSNIMHDDF